MTLQRCVTTTPARPERTSPTAATRIDGLTGLRFFFALLVVCHHSVQHWFGPASYPVADFGYIGVDLFFVLSGFVLAWPSRPVRRGRFWWDRMSRVWPLHLLFVLVGLALIGYGVDRPTGGTLLANVVLVQAWFPSSTTYFSINSVSWSLSCELFFYLAFPWLIAWLQPMVSSQRRRVAALIIVALAIYPGLFSLTIAPSAPGPHEWSTYVLPLWRMGEFLLGIIAALEVRAGWRPRLSGAAALWVMVVASAGLLADGLAQGHLPDRAIIEVVGACLAALAFAAVAADEVAGRRSWYGRPWMVTLGASSYALYLLHALLFGALVAIATWTGPGLVNPLAWTGYILLAVLLSIGVHRWIELPVERWLRAHRPTAAR